MGKRLHTVEVALLVFSGLAGCNECAELCAAETFSLPVIWFID